MIAAVERHGYFVPATGSLCGDPELAQDAVVLWVMHRDRLIENDKHAGASIVLFDDGMVTRTLVEGHAPKCRVTRVRGY